MTARLAPSDIRPHEEIDISSIAFWSQAPEIRDQSFAKLRAKGGVSWHPPVEAQPVPATSAGFWAVTTHAGVVEVSRDWERFSSSGTSISIYEVTPQMLESTTAFLPMDPPAHTRYRRLVSKAFTPRQIERIHTHIDQRTKEAVDRLLDAGPGDFVTTVSNYVPSQVIGDMVGVNDDMRDDMTDVVTRLLVFGDPGVRREGEDSIVFFARMLFDLHAIGRSVLEEKKSKPGDDLITSLIESEAGGERLTDDEIVSFFCALAVAGTDTTRNAATFGLRAFTEFPDQRRLLLEDLPGRLDAAVVEVARWSSPVASFVRRATRDTEVNGASIAEGDRVAVFYLSANRDDAVFENPWQFDIARDNSRQIAWGGGGPHYCLGANLAKVEMSSLFRELFTRVPTVRAVDEPVYASSPMVSSIEHQLCEWD